MRPDFSPVERDVGTVVHPHLVVKRGHRGRYRFTMIYDGERIGGEVWVDVHPGTPDDLRALALAKITRLAEALQAGIEARAPVGLESGAQADPGERSFKVDEAHSRRQTVPGARDDHGQI